MKVILIRHFETPGNRERRYIGHTDETLEEAGLITRVDEVRSRLEIRDPVEEVAASPMKRCVQTAALLFPDKEPLLLDELKECNFGLFEGRNYEELKELPAYRNWLGSRGTLPFPGGEGHAAFRSRCVRGFDKAADAFIRGKCGCAAIVAHGGTVMSVLSCYAPGQSGFYDWQPGNGGGFVITLDAAEWKKGKKGFTEIETL